MTDDLSDFDAALAKLPPPLQPLLARDREDFVPHLATLPARGPQGQDWLTALPRVWAGSDFVARGCVQHPSDLAALVASGDLFRAYDDGELTARAARAAADAADEAGLKRALRALRRREMLRIAWRDLAGWAGLPEVLAALTALADACLQAALTRLTDWAMARHGQPRGADGRPAQMVVLGMGKLGGGELNFSSDIDLIFGYSADGETEQDGLSNQQFFMRLGRALIAALDEATEDGMVFRVDMRLRPNGASAPLALSFDATELYYQVHGREWERYAMIKARVVAGDAAAGAELLARLKPFVFRRYIDYGAVEAIRSLKVMIERELARKGLEHNIKLGPGGIREIEFIGQAFQLIRGGRDPALRQRPIRAVLAALGAAGYLIPQAISELDEAYVFLRRAENRLQELDDRQTHNLPPDPLNQLRLALAMGYPDWDGFYTQLRRHMKKVHGHFDQVFVAPQGEQAEAGDAGLAGVWLASLSDDAAGRALQAAGYKPPEPAAALLSALRDGSAYRAFSAQGRERLDRLMPLLIAAAGLTPEPLTTLTRLTKIVEAIGRRSVYLALLVENPLALSQLVKLSAASQWIADWIAQHPVLLDELIDPVSLYAPLARDALAAELQARLAHLPPDDLEAQMEVLREFRHGHVLRVAAADVGPGLSPVATGAYLADIAETVVDAALSLATDNMVAKHGSPTCRDDGDLVTPGFAVIAYGKLGSRELGYSSDLDMIFLHGPCAGEGGTDGPRPLANEVFFARLGQRLIHILTTRTPAGILYPVDMRLRPSGQAGALVTHPAAFADYQRERAWTWEHQALVRARPIAGDPALCQAFDAVRSEILCRERDPARLKADVLEMRQRMRDAQAPHDPGQFDLKQDPGGMIDIEFMVQYWVLWRAHGHPGLIRHRDNTHILEALAGAGLLDAGMVQELADAYRRYLSVEHRLKLMERQSLVAPAELGDHPGRVQAIWRQVFE